VKTALFNIPDYNIIKNPILSRSEVEEFPHFFYHPTQAKGSVEKPVIEELEFVGTGLVPVLTLRRTATRAVPTITSPC